MIVYETKLTTVQILYYRPDYRSLLQEFVWQTPDVPPRFPRVCRFLDYWKQNIDAVIAEIILAYAGRRGEIRHADAMFLLDKCRVN